MESSFHQALHALFGSDPNAQHEANTWLTSFATTPEAWGGCLSLLEPSTPAQAAFFAANMLLSKARSEWGGLEQTMRDQLQAAVR